MKYKLPNKSIITKHLDDFRFQTARADALVHLSILGLSVGVLTSLVLTFFIFCVNSALALWLPLGDSENFESLNLASRLLAPVLGSVILLLIYRFIAKESDGVGVVNVLERLRYHDGLIQLRSLVLQFIGAAVALVSGHSVGREGPAIHMGSAVGSVLGQQLKLPHNSVRTLLACGSAAAISAAFNTPLAGVIFAMEVIVVEYSFASFIPIMIAAVVAAGIAQWAFGSDALLHIDAMPSISAAEIPFLILLGVLVGCASTLFTYLIKAISIKTQSLGLSMRFILAGFVTGTLALLIPEIMGMGYDTINAAILGQLSMSLLFAIMLLKLIATACAIACGIPAGLISPSLVIGAVGGALMASFLHHTLELPIQNSGIYAIIGMSAMMGACLQAPLAALTAVFEITTHHNIIWPSMLSIVVAQLVSRQIFKQPPVFDLLLSLRGFSYQHDPVTQSLQRSSVKDAMSEDYVCLARVFTRNTLEHINLPEWIVIEDNQMPVAAIAGHHLIAYLEQHPELDAIDLLDAPLEQHTIASIDIRSTLAKAREMFSQEKVAMLCVTHWNPLAQTFVQGVISRESFNQTFIR